MLVAEREIAVSVVTAPVNGDPSITECLEHLVAQAPVE